MIAIFLAAWLYLAAHATVGSALGAPADGPESARQAPITTPEVVDHAHDAR
jgi:hypothetical protein